MLWLWQQVKSSVVWYILPWNSSMGGGMSHRAVLPVFGAVQIEAKQEEGGKGSVVCIAHQLRRHWGLRALNSKQVLVSNIMGGGAWV